MPHSLSRSTSEYNLLPFEAYDVEGDERSIAGPCRMNNEDRSALLIPQERQHLLRQGLLALVADGMGGHEGGEVASDLAATLVPQHYQQLAESTPGGLPGMWLQEAFQLANQRIFETATQQTELAGMGTTCTGLVIRAGLAWCAHVGDSRAYLVRETQVYRMTQDHSATMEMVNRGLLSLADARHHEDRNVILRAMGTSPEVQVSLWKDPFPIRTGDCFVLCSDGLHDVLNDDEIGEQCVAGVSASRICDALIHLANTRQASDNVTAVVLCVRGANHDAHSVGSGGLQP